MLPFTEVETIFYYPVIVLNVSLDAYRAKALSSLPATLRAPSGKG